MNRLPLPVSPLQFGVVREDPRIELELVEQFRCRRICLVASGGCTALALLGVDPSLELTLVDPNPAQLALVRRKLDALEQGDDRALGVGASPSEGLHESGNFERLFRVLRTVLDLFVVGPAERRARLERGERDWLDVTAHNYWPVAFELAFADPFLEAMFGPEAVQHAPPGSYPAYFRERVEAGLAAPDVGHNPWLHHLLLGSYLSEPAAWPPFLRQRPPSGTDYREAPGSFQDLTDFSSFDLVDLSNVLDWTDDAGCAHLAGRLRAELRPGALVLWRQLNDPRGLLELFREGFRSDPEQDVGLTARERSLFYDQVHVVQRCR